MFLICHDSAAGYGVGGVPLLLVLSFFFLQYRLKFSPTIDSRALATLSGVALTTSFRRSPLFMSAALITGGPFTVGTGGTMGCNSISWMTTEDLGDALAAMLACLHLK